MRLQLHVHRESIRAAREGVPDARIWVAHFEGWTRPQRFRSVIVEAPCRTAEGGLPGYGAGPDCGCANAWLELDVSAEQLEYSDNYSTFIVRHLTDDASSPRSKRAAPARR